MHMSDDLRAVKARPRVIGSGCGALRGMVVWWVYVMGELGDGADGMRRRR